MGADAREQVGDGVCWRVVVLRYVRHLPVTAPPDRLIFIEENHITIPAGWGVARPFPAGKDDERSVLVKGPRLVVQSFPVVIGHLKIVTLVRAEVEAGDVAGE